MQTDTLTGFKRSHYCAELRAGQINQRVQVCGWVQGVRNLGGLIFIDLRDRTGIIQLAFDGESDPALFAKAAGMHSEYVVAAAGMVRRRAAGAVNEKLPTGEVEVYVDELRLLSAAKTPPFEIVENANVSDELLLKYRYLDLRRPDAKAPIMLRHKIAKAARDYYDRNGFLEIETPFLVRSTPEGARDYLVPSRKQPGKFYALPQSPQQYKQLLMLAGFDRYMQIVKCFRDEDLRADRQPEFTQIDLEMSFVDEDEIMRVNEGFIKELFAEILGVEVPTPFPRLSYEQAMTRYGSDKPDVRFGFELVDLSDLVAGCGFGVFAGAVAAGGSVRAIKIDGGASFTRKEIDAFGEYVKTYRAKGLAFLKKNADGTITCPFAKFLSERELEAILARTGVDKGDILFVIASEKNKVVFDALGALRCHIAQKLGLSAVKDRFAFLWVTDFPLLEYDEEDGRYYAMHHPFTSPKEEDIPLLESDPGKVHARAYDMVLNGTELGGGSIRIHDSELQEKMFAALGFSKEEAEKKFGFLIQAFQYGAPPHGGMAYGLDRLVMLMSGRDSIRDVIAFPKMQNASEIMTDCPAPVEDKQLQELHLITKIDE